MQLTSLLETLEPVDNEITEKKIKCITLVLLYKSKTSTRPGDSFEDDTTTGLTSDNTTREPVP
jgi:hypothetical protein